MLVQKQAVASLSSLAPQSAATRQNWIDSTRGIGILLVVVGHTWRGLENAALINNQALFSVIDRLIYAFHMPLFFFISGVLFNTSSKKPIGASLSSKAIRLLWPLAVWTWIFYLFKVASGQSANAPVTLAEFSFFPLPPRDHFWFLWALFLINVAFILLVPALRRVLPQASEWALLAVLSVTLFFASANLEVHDPWFGDAMAYAPYFVLGVYCAKLKLHAKAPLSIWFAIAVFGAAELAAIYGPATSLADLTIGATATLSLAVIVIVIERWHGSAPWMTFLRFLGFASMAIYVSHIIFSAAARILLLHMGVIDLWAHLFIGTLAGVLGPLALLYAARQCGATRILGL